MTVLEFLSIAVSDEDLGRPWIRRAAARLCALFQKTRRVPLECGALYHAAHGLALYRERMFGQREQTVEAPSGVDKVNDDALNDDAPVFDAPVFDAP